MSLKRRAFDKHKLDNGQGVSLRADDESVSKDALKALIHDMNNALMLIGITAEQLEDKARKADEKAESEADNEAGTMQKAADTPNPTSEQTYAILRRNINEMRQMLIEIAHIMPQALTPEGAVSSFTDKDLAEFLEEQKADWLLLALPETQITIQVDPFEGHLAVMPAYLTRIFNNLMRNACEAYLRLNHGQKDTIGACVITLHAAGEKGRLLIQVQDNGPGIQQDRQEDIFAPYCSTKAHSDLPTGIGLTNARKLATQMGGELSLAPLETSKDPKNKGKGALFLLTFPLHQEESP